MGSIQEHSQLINRCILATPMLFPDLVALEFDAGDARALHNPEIRFKYGNEGYPDVTLISWGSRWTGFEMKTGKAVFNEAQKRFKGAVSRVDGEVHKIISVRQYLETLLDLAIEAEKVPDVKKVQKKITQIVNKWGEQ